MNFDRLLKELRDNASEGKFEDNEFLYERISQKMERYKRKYEVFKKQYKLLQPRLCEGCGETKHKKFFSASGTNYYTCDDCMKKRKKNRRKQKRKEKVEEQLGTYTKDECRKLYTELEDVIYERYMSEVELKKFVIKVCEDYELSEVRAENGPLFCFDDICGIREEQWGHLEEFEPTVFDDVAYNKTGTVLTIIIEKLRKCRKRTQEEKDDM